MSDIEFQDNRIFLRKLTSTPFIHSELQKLRECGIRATFFNVSEGSMLAQMFKTAAPSIRASYLRPAHLRGGLHQRKQPTVFCSSTPRWQPWPFSQSQCNGSSVSFSERRSVSPTVGRNVAAKVSVHLQRWGKIFQSFALT